MGACILRGGVAVGLARIERTAGLVSFAAALVWIIYTVTRQQRISSGRFVDQLGMALTLLSVLIFISNFSGLFGK
jgi:hypothetical protein